MSFNVQNWAKVNTSAINAVVTLQSGVTIGANNSYNYQTNADTVATVSAANYFNTVAAELSIGDTIYCYCSNGTVALTVATVTVGPAAAVTTTVQTSPGDVSGPSGATSGHIASFNGSTGLIIQDSGIAAASVVVGPVSVTAGNLASYSGTTGKLVADSGVLAANVVTNSAAGGLVLPNAANTTSYTVVVKNITCSHTELATAGTVTLLPSTGTQQYQILNIFLNKGGTNFSGGGGDRLGQVTDATSIFTVIPATDLQTLVNSGWGSTPVPYPASVAIDTLTAAGAPVVFAYSGGTTDYTAGSLVITVVAIQVA